MPVMRSSIIWCERLKDFKVIQVELYYWLKVDVRNKLIVELKNECFKLINKHSRHSFEKLNMDIQANKDKLYNYRYN